MRGEARAYYNEIDRDAVHVLRSLIADGLIADGDVDDRSIVDVRPDDLVGYTQCHFFAGAGLWSVAARMAGWPDDRPLWTGSCPCQPFSAAGRGLGTDDPRHLWPDFFRLIRAGRPPVVMGEQVAGAPGYGWFDGVRSDLAGEGFASRTVDIPVCAVDAPHIRQRLYWLAVEHAASNGREQGLAWAEASGYGREPASTDRGIDGAMADRPRDNGRRGLCEQGSTGNRVGQPANRACPACGGRGRIGPFFPGGISSRCANCSLVDASRLGWREGRAEPELRGRWPAASIAEASGVTLGDAFGSRLEGQRGHGDDGRGWPEAPRPVASADGRNGSAWAGAEWLACHDGKARRTEPGIRLLVDGMAGRVPAWRLAGNSISPVLAAEVIGAFLDVEGSAA